MFNAISLGVFCREAPSTNLIIRSRKVSPGFEVIRTLISSESTRVPPVTADRSPPHSRITGADSPVIADSSTDATPSITSPSPGTNSPAVTITKSPARNCDPGTDSMLPSCFNRRATVSARDLRKASACAFPRPSAIASAKFANSTVNHSHKVICSENPNPCECCTTPRTKSMDVSSAPTSTTNITGLAASVRGFSLTNDSHTACTTISCPQRDFSLLVVLVAMGPKNTFPACIIKCSRIGPRLNAGKNVNALTISTTETSSTVNNGVVTGKVPADSGTYFFRARLPAIARMGITAKNLPNKVANPIVVLYQRVFPFNPPNAEPLFPVAEVYAYKICDNPCGPGFEIDGTPNDFATTEIAVNVKITSGKISTDSIAIFTSYASIFFPRYSGVLPTISPAIKTERITNTIIP